MVDVIYKWFFFVKLVSTPPNYYINTTAAVRGIVSCDRGVCSAVVGPTVHYIELLKSFDKIRA